MQQYGLIGYPLGHSLSPLIHRELFQCSGREGDYRLIEITPQTLVEKFNDLKGLSGFNVTIPHKMAVVPLLDSISDRASLYGAVNTVQIKDGRTFGHNTDCYGFLRSLDSAGIPLAGKVLVCGAGGVARMFAFEAVLAGADVTVAVRDADLPAANALAADTAEKLQKEIHVTKLNQVNGNWDLIVNGTPVGMFPKVDACVLDAAVIQKAGAVFDAVYNPSQTLFIKTAADFGIPHLNGLPMLVWQAAVAQEIWNDVSFSKEQIDEVIAITARKSGTI